MPLPRLVVFTLGVAILGNLLALSHGQPPADPIGIPEPRVGPLLLPPWLQSLDADGDGQVNLFEWRGAGGTAEKFSAFDTNNDGFITPEEMADAIRRASVLELVGGSVVHHGVVEKLEEKHRGKASYRVLFVELAAGKDYRFDLVSPAFQSALIVEDREEAVAEVTARFIGQPCQVTFRAARTAKYRLIVTSLAGVRTGPFTLTIRAVPRKAVLPAGYVELDIDGDSQISLFEWRTGEKAIDEFLTLDRNGDGFVTADELARANEDRGPDLRFARGKAQCAGTVEEFGEPYLGKRSYRAVTAELEAGKTYQFELHSPMFQSSLLVEHGKDEQTTEGSASFIGAPCRLKYRATRTGIHRLIATSVGGYRTGTFTLTAQVENAAGQVPSWFTALDIDGDSQVSLFEWRTGRKAIDEFLALDTNIDGFITSEELERNTKKGGQDLKLVRNRLAHSGTIGEAVDGVVHRGKRSFQTLTVVLEANRTYHFLLVSPAYQSFVFIEDASGEAVAEGGAPGVGEECKLAYRATRTGIHKLIVTSVGGFRTGSFNLSIQMEDRYHGLPVWFEPADTDQDGQLSLYEWRTGGGDTNLFVSLDRNGDGYLTVEELQRGPDR